MSETQSSHWDDCYKSHHACAVAEVERLREENHFFKSLMHSHSLKMSGVSSYSFRGGWLTNQIVGNGKDEAVRNAIKARNEERDGE